jgi:c-di-GMP-binding flagellar brake protein YcgR
MENPQLPSTAQRRDTERAREVLLVSYTIAADIAPEYTETYDIAIGGLAMLTNAALTPNVAITIDLELRGDTRPKLRLNGSVRWSTYDPLLEKYRTGVSFSDASAEFERELLRYIDALESIRQLGVH